MSYTDATDQVLAVLDDFKLNAFENDEQYEALANAIRKAIAMHVCPGMPNPLQDPGVQGLAQLGRNAIERVAQLEAELAGYVEANKYMKGELDDALEDARKYAEAQREIARLRDALAPFAKIADHFPQRREFGNRPCEGLIYAWHTSGFPDAEMTVEHVHAARAALAQVAESPE